MLPVVLFDGILAGGREEVLRLLVLTTHCKAQWPKTKQPGVQLRNLQSGRALLRAGVRC